MENDLSLFLAALINHPIRITTSFLFVAGTVYAAGSLAGFDNSSSMTAGLIAGGFFAYRNTVNSIHQQQSGHNFAIQLSRQVADLIQEDVINQNNNLN